MGEDPENWGPENWGPEDQELADETGETRSQDQASAVAVSRPKGSTGAGARSRKANKKADKSPARATRAAQRAARRAAKLKAYRARAQQAQAAQGGEPRPAVYGDAAYGAGELLAYLGENGTGPRVKTQPPSAPGGLFTKDRSVIDLGAGTVACPAGNTAPISFDQSGAGTAHFGGACANCPLGEACTTSKAGRTVGISAYEELIQAQRERCADPEFAADYRGARPKVERKFGHLMRHRHGGRRARVRGRRKVDADFNLLAGAHNLARLAKLGLRSTAGGWVATAVG